MTEVAKADAHVDYGVVSGYFVRLDVGVEGDQSWVALTSGEARSLADQLTASAVRVDSLNQSQRPPTDAI